MYIIILNSFIISLALLSQMNRKEGLIFNVLQMTLKTKYLFKKNIFFISLLYIFWNKDEIFIKKQYMKNTSYEP